ncbi:MULTISPECIES: Tellurium resistance [unclassified Streptomyces]|uniref:Tellurium resistance n=1 Tax=unclassified Streptomyces TaxID=2593676 RepID=UPI0022B6957D|nr:MULTISPECIES: Tellurium resistance [unclassified Streptomyces]MCZ7414059.1 Tellurium resistance [Streptomyces sp. WMMC897]MCZ7431055.1 Tellurium resistance [Streptomyces sp. WMMC1477]
MVSLWEHWRSGVGRGRGPKFDTVGGPLSYAVELTRRHPRVSLSQEGADSGTLRVTLSWRMRSSDLEERTRRRFSLRNPLQLLRPEPVNAHTQGMVNVDLDLACMYELTDGSKGVVQPLGGFLGAMHEPPYVKLSGDDRFGTGSGEIIYVNLDHVEEIKRLLFFVYIYDGTPAFDRTHAVVTLVPSNGPQVEVGLDERAPDARSCAVLMIERDRNGDLVARREVRYVYGFQADLDRLYGWGMTWGRGYKSPSGR